MKRLSFLLLAAIGVVAPAAGAPSDASVRAGLQRDINQYLTARAKTEHISGISLSISLHGQTANINLTAGKTQYGGGGASITPGNLWEIGSNTKSFTAVTILQLEAEGKLTIDQTIGRWLPQYPAWKNVTIRRLLNMTSGVPTYDAVPAMLADLAREPNRNFTIPELIAYVYPTNPKAPPPTKGYSYSNANYLLAELIIERATGHSYSSEIERRFFQRLNLTETYYSGTQYPRDVTDRMVSGYFFSHDADNAALGPLLGRDVSKISVSWMKGAGAIVSTPEDLTRWARALYTGTILAPKQQAELLSLVSTKTGEPIAKTSSSDPRGFGLGVAQMTQPDTGTIWFYEGETLGYRMLHVYFPQQDAAVAFGLNSQPDSKQDQSGKLAIAVYKTLHAAGLL